MCLAQRPNGEKGMMNTKVRYQQRIRTHCEEEVESERERVKRKPTDLQKSATTGFIRRRFAGNLQTIYEKQCRTVNETICQTQYQQHCFPFPDLKCTEKDQEQ